MENNRNFFITIALSVLILTLWQVFYMNPRIEAQREAARVEAERVEAESRRPCPHPSRPPASPVRPRPAPPAPFPAAPAFPAPTGPRRRAATPRWRRRSACRSTRRAFRARSTSSAPGIDDIRLKDYRLTVEKNSPTIELLNPAALPNG